MTKQGKTYVEAAKKVDADKIYSIDEAVKLAIEMKRVKFDETVEMHIKTGCDVAKPDQIVRGTVTLPHGTGKSVKVVVFCDEGEVAACKKAGAEIAGEELEKKVADGWMDFDIAVATPAMMPKIAKLARTLGPKGLMPSPKAGTVSEKPDETVKELKAGRVEFKTDAKGQIHVSVGKVSFGEKKLLENVVAMLDAVKEKKPSGLKGLFLKKISMATTMGPGILVER